MRINSNLLIDLMATHGMKISELSRISGVSRKTIQLAMDNITQNVKPDTVKNLARALSIKPDKLLEGGKC